MTKPDTAPLIRIFFFFFFLLVVVRKILHNNPFFCRHFENVVVTFLDFYILVALYATFK